MRSIYCFRSSGYRMKRFHKCRRIGSAIWLFGKACGAVSAGKQIDKAAAETGG